MKPILAFDAAMGGCSAAVLDPATGRTVSEILPMARGQSEILVPMVERVIRKSGFSFADLGLVVTTIGPGAFTGLRIGLSAARSFGLALDIPVVGVMTTEVLASAFKKERKNKLMLVVLETKREDFYAQGFSAEGQTLSPPETLPGEAIIKRHAGDELAVLGDGVARLRLECAWPQAWEQVDGYELPDPEVMAAMGLEQMRSGTLVAAEPVYLREADVSQSTKVMRTIAESER